LTAVSADWVLPLDGPPIEGGRVRFEDARIVEVGPGRAERHFADAVILPGFVNAHSHLEYANYAGFGDGEPFGPWIKTHVERKNKLAPEEMLAIARLGVADSLRSGITTTADYSYSGAAATAADDLGLRAIVYLEVFALDPREAERQWLETRGRVSDSHRVTIGISPHAPYTCSIPTYEWCLSLGVPVGTHLAESANETEWLEHGRGPLAGIAPLLVPPTGRRPVATLEPVLGPDLLCAHCVEVEPAEVALLAERGVRVAHCPRSNALLGCGIAPVALMRDAGVIVGLGTDSPASTPSFDVFEELRAAVYLARALDRMGVVLG
jgi:5-methylthioadenosine/S-adenosylhomocysteine deaminase